MSSYELLELAEFLPEHGAFRTAVRGDSWTETELIAAETHNELARLRAGYHAVNGGHEAAYEPFTFEDASIRREQAAEAAAREQFHGGVRDDMFSHFGWTPDTGEEGGDD